jgi:hypothetical protein
MKKVIRRPSPAMIVAIVALIAALGGTAVAGGFITKKKAKNIANNVVTQRAPGLSVASAKNADHATNADNATNATTANKAKNVFFAQVDYSNTNTTPDVISGSPGIVGNGEAFLGAPRLTFPQNMQNCAVNVNLTNGGGDGFGRWSGQNQGGVSSGANVVVVLNDEAGSDTRSPYSIVAVCP